MCHAGEVPPHCLVSSVGPPGCVFADRATRGRLSLCMPHALPPTHNRHRELGASHSGPGKGKRNNGVIDANAP